MGLTGGGVFSGGWTGRGVAGSWTCGEDGTPIIARCIRGLTRVLGMIIAVGLSMNFVGNFFSRSSSLSRRRIPTAASMFSLVISGLNITRLSALNFCSNRSASHVLWDILHVHISVARSSFAF